MLVLSTILSLAMGSLVFIIGQQHRIKFWFLVLCIAAAALSIGLWVEQNVPAWSFFAARINMTSALLLAICGLISIRTLYGLPVRAPIVAVALLATVADVITVWVTGDYFTGELIHYRWGVWVAGNPSFLLNPILVASIAFIGLVNLWTQYRAAGPLDRNRAKYIFLANLFFFASALDYLPHFGIDLFGGPVSGFSISAFMVVYGYAMLRFRLFEFHALVGRFTGWFLAAVLLGTTYGLVLELGRRVGLAHDQAYFGAAVAAFIVWMALVRQLPEWTQRLLSREPNFMVGISRPLEDVTVVQEEIDLYSKWTELCISIFDAKSARFIRNNEFAFDFAGYELIEREVVQRAGENWPEAALDADILLPLWRRDQLLGIMAVGARRNNRMYPQEALDGLRHAASAFSVAMYNVRASAEIERRHELDRYLAPQVIDSILRGDINALEKKRRVTITVFFSDIQRFSELADHIDPDTLAIIMNDYLASMADIAFAHGGTVDKFIGDAIMVLFGAPIDEEPAKQVRQCVSMACKMHVQLDELNQRWRIAGFLTDGLRSRMGIHTGEATVGSFGSNARVEYTALGRSVNLAWRLQTACEPNRILVSAQTWQHSEASVPGRRCEAIFVKGFADAVEVFEINPELLRSTSLDEPEQAIDSSL